MMLNNNATVACTAVLKPAKSVDESLCQECSSRFGVTQLWLGKYKNSWLLIQLYYSNAFIQSLF